jgi:hypothetical protein
MFYFRTIPQTETKTMSKNRVCVTATGLPKINRRAVLAALPAAPLVALPVASVAQASHDEDDMLDYLIAIAFHTGLTLDELFYWFRGIHSEVVGRIMQNALKAPLPQWGKSATRSAVIGFKASEIFAHVKNPLSEYCERQIRIRADRAEAAAVLKCYWRSAKDFPSLMDMV